jgi:methyl-accepting chemotaxis protein
MVISILNKVSDSIGVVGGDLALDGLVELINSLNFGGMGYAFLVNDQGKILVHPNKDLVMKSLSDLFRSTRRNFPAS